MKYRIFRLLLLAAVFTILIVPAVEAKEKNAEPVTVQTTEITPASHLTPVQPEEVLTIEATKDARAGEEINWQVISGGGNIGGTSASYTLSGTVGQTATGGGTSASYGLSHGFWQLFGGGGGCCDTPGDANNDGGCNLGDAGYIINYIFYDGPAPVCAQEGDANADGGVNLGDAGFIINYIFYDGPSPTCGP